MIRCLLPKWSIRGKKKSLNLFLIDSYEAIFIMNHLFQNLNTLQQINQGNGYYF